MNSTKTLPAREQEDLYAEDREMGSVVSYPRRCPLWGDWSFRGNCDGQLFKNLVLRYAAKRVADPMMGSGTTKDVIEGLNRLTGAGIDFWGSDLAEGFDLLHQDLPGRYDFVWIHPPYWDIVRYSEHASDLSNCADYGEYLGRLAICLSRCREALLPGGRLAILIADDRRRGVYTPIIRDVLNLEPHLGQLRSIIIKHQHNCRSDKKTYASMEDVRIRHEYCVVFKKV